MKYIYTIQLLLLSVLQVNSQNLFNEKESKGNCEEKLEKAMPFITGSPTILQDGDRALGMLTDCVRDRDPEVMHTVGLMFMGANRSIPTNYKTGFDLVKLAAELDHADAACNLAIFYQMGKGCKLDFDKAREWYKTSYALGNQKAAFKLGYMYFKGLGSIEQSYSKSLEWFQKSNYPMAEYFLGIHYYFGFGVPINKEKAQEVMIDSKGQNTKALFNFLFDDLREKVAPKDIIKAAEAHEKEANIISQSSESNTAINEDSKALDINTLEGDWAGKLVELDWSQTKIVRSIPIALNLSKDKSVGSLDYKFTINNQTIENFGVSLGNEYYFEKLHFALPRIYQDAFSFINLEYNMNSATFQKTEIDGITYLTASLDGHVKQWNEPSPPMQLVLVQTGATTENGKEISEDLLQALAASKDDGFITLYPNPFETDLLIEYQLEETNNVEVLIYSFEGQDQYVVEAGKEQPADKYVYHFDGSNLKSGLYIVRVTANGQPHTKLIVKK